MKVLAVLRAARELIAEADHLMKREYTDYHGNYCAIGAVRASHSAATSCWDFKSSKYLARAASELFPSRVEKHSACGTGRVANFNDHSLTTKEDVLKVYDRAIELAKQWKQVAR